MKSVAALLSVCLVLVAVCAEAKEKRSVVIGAPIIASAPVVATHAAVPLASVVHHNPATTVVKTEQVHNGDQSSYSYSSEVRAAHPVASAAVVQTAAAVPAAAVVQQALPSYAYYTNHANYAAYPYGWSALGYHPYAYSVAAYSPYQYWLRK